MTRYHPGSIVTLDPPDAWYVYELWDDSAEPFYVGMSSNPRARLRAHRTPPKYSKNDGVSRTIAALKNPVRMLIVSVHETRRAAERAELIHIRKHTGLVNVDVSRKRAIVAR